MAGKRLVTMKGVLSWLDDVGDVMLPMSRKQVYRQLNNPKFPDWEDYFPSRVERVVKRLERKGLVARKKAGDGIKLTLTEEGKKTAWLENLENFEPKKGKWDGKWRIVIFDVDESRKKKRNLLRKYLKRLGFWQIQKSVWINPFDCGKEVKYLRVVLGIDSEVRWVVAEELENGEELIKIFRVE